MNSQPADVASTTREATGGGGRGRAAKWLREFFLQEERLAGAKLAGYQPSDPGFREYSFALAALRNAHESSSSSNAEHQVLLQFHAATRLLIRATLLRSGNLSPDATWEAIWHAGGSAILDALLPAGVLRQKVTEVLGRADGEVALAAMSRADSVKVLFALRGVSQRLARPLEESALLIVRILWRRRMRWAMAGLVLALGLGAGLSRILVRPNLALHRPVVVSERDPQYGPDPQQVVDGDRLNLGFHTGETPGTTVTIDLGTIRPIRRVDVYNRADFYQDRATPLGLQLSDDGRSYRNVVRRVHRFQIWKAPLPSGTTARYVRLVHESTECFHLAEIEVY